MRKEIVSKKAIIFGIIIMFVITSVVTSIERLDNKIVFGENIKVNKMNEYMSQPYQIGALGDTPWWNTNWMYRKQITIDHNQVAGNLVNFPVLVITTMDTSKVQTNGNDIVFTDNDGTRLNHEIESYSSTTGKLVAWLQVTSLSNTLDTILYMYYGNPTCGNQQNKYGVWTGDYSYVYHMKDNSATTVCDSTSHQYNSIKLGPGQPSETNGKIGTGENFVQSTSDYLNLGDKDDFTFTNEAQTADLPFSVSVWIKMNPSTFQPSYSLIFGKDVSGSSEYHFYYYHYPSQGSSNIALVLLTNTGAFLVGKVMKTLSLNVWYYLTVTYDGGVSTPRENGVKIYINGTSQTMVASHSGTYDHMRNTDSNLFIGKYDWSPPWTFNGVLDEVETLKNVELSSEWISTSYNNQNNPSTFMNIGEEETFTLPPNQPPIADAGGTYHANVNDLNTFDGSGSHDTDGTIAGYRWDFTNDGTYDTGWLTSATTTHGYSSNGIYTVKLQVKDDDGATSTDTTTATILPEVEPIPIANVNGPYSGYVNSPIIFSSAGSTGGSDGTITSWYWTFGDGTFTNLQNPTHSYTSTGTFTVTLKVTNNYGTTGTDTTKATIIPTPLPGTPHANAGGPYSGVVGSPITFGGSGSTDSDGTITSYIWNFGDSNTGTGVSPTHTYNTEGNYTVVLTVTDNDGKTNSSSIIASIKPIGPPTIVISTVTSNIEPIEEENEKTISVTVTCYNQSVRNIHLEILESSNLTFTVLSPDITLNPGESRDLFVKIKAPKLKANVTVGSETIRLKAVGDGNVTSNTEQINLKVVKKGATPGFETVATITAVASAGALVTFFRRRNRNR
jgi:PKD repeat protein